MAFATVEENKPKIRVFQIMKREKETLYFATATHKEVYQQLQKILLWNYLQWLEIFQ